MNSKRHARIRKLQVQRSWHRWMRRVFDYSPCKCATCREPLEMQS